MMAYAYEAGENVTVETLTDFGNNATEERPWGISQGLSSSPPTREITSRIISKTTSLKALELVVIITISIRAMELVVVIATNIILELLAMTKSIKVMELVVMVLLLSISWKDLEPLLVEMMKVMKSKADGSDQEVDIDDADTEIEARVREDFAENK